MGGQAGFRTSRPLYVFSLLMSWPCLDVQYIYFQSICIVCLCVYGKGVEQSWLDLVSSDRQGQCC